MATLNHGNYTTYSNGYCRCNECRRAMAEHIKGWRARHRGKLAPDSSRHGKRSTYINWGCRCDPCTQADLEWQRAYKARKRAKA